MNFCGTNIIQKGGVVGVRFMYNTYLKECMIGRGKTKSVTNLVFAPTIVTPFGNCLKRKSNTRTRGSSLASSSSRYEATLTPLSPSNSCSDSSSSEERKQANFSEKKKRKSVNIVQ